MKEKFEECLLSKRNKQFVSNVLVALRKIFLGPEIVNREKTEESLLLLTAGLRD